MKPSFHARPVNGPFDDPGLYVRILREGRAIIFDAGFTTSLSSGDMLKISDIFISHTHVDHFIGFDNILRVSLKKEKTLNLYGPHGITECVESKLRSYTWNVIEHYPLVIAVVEVSDKHIHRSVFKARNSFRREEVGAEPYQYVLKRDMFSCVSAVVLDHQIPCLAFSLEEDYHINIDKSKLSKLGLPVGPWLGELKAAIRQNKKNSVFIVNGRTYSFRELRGVANITKGQKLAYVVDALGSDENIKKIVHLAQGADVLYIETYFLEEDRDLARDRYHLTAKQAGRIAREAAVGRIEAIHFSPRYSEEGEKLAREAEQEFRK